MSRSDFQRKQSCSYSIFHPNYTLNSEVVKFLKKHKNKKNILDYGAGNMPYKSLFQCDKYYSIDIQQNISESIDLVIEPNTHIAIDSNFDLVLLLDVLEHVSDPILILKNLHEHMTYGGELLISVPFIYREHEMPFDFYRYTSSGIKSILDTCGFVDIEILKTGNRFFTLYSLWSGSLILNGEINNNFFGRAIRRVISISILPILNITLFKNKINSNEGTYHHLLIKCIKK